MTNIYKGRVRWTHERRRVAVAARVTAKILDEISDDQIPAVIEALLTPVRPESRRVLELLTEGQFRDDYWPDPDTWTVMAIILAESTADPYEERRDRGQTASPAHG